MRSHASAPRSHAKRAPRPAIFAPARAARHAGPIGRPPDGPRRSSSVTPAPIARPTRAAVRRSYWASRGSFATAPRADPRTRGRVSRDPAAFPFVARVLVGLTVVAMVDLLQSIVIVIGV